VLCLYVVCLCVSVCVSAVCVVCCVCSSVSGVNVYVSCLGDF